MRTPDSSWVPSVLAEYEQPLTRYAAHITGDIERAREVVQDTFLKLLPPEAGRNPQPSGAMALHSLPQPGAGCA